MELKIKKYGLSYKGYVQKSTNLKHLKLIADQIRNSMFGNEKCEIFDYDTGETIY